MIRRNAGTDWVLLSQIEHAHLSADLAAAWVEPHQSLTLPCPDWLLYAIRHHDDGWQDWATAPQIDPATGIPLSFNEMPMATATQLWSTSVEICNRYNNWAGLWVNLHFCWLANRAVEHRRDDDPERPVIKQFIQKRQASQHEWFQNLPGEITIGNDQAFHKGTLVIQGFRALQFFDRLSLWLCMNSIENAPADKPPTLKLPFDQRHVFEFRMTESNVVQVKPFPFRQPALRLATTGQRLPQQAFVDSHSFQQALAGAPTEELAWTFLADGQ